MRLLLVPLMLLSVGCSDVKVVKDAVYDPDLMGVPALPGAKVKGAIVTESEGNRVVTYVLITGVPYDSVVSFYLREADGTDSVAAGQLYTIRRGTELLIQIKEEGDHREINITRAVPLSR